MGSFSCPIPRSFVLSSNMPMINTTSKLASFWRFCNTVGSLPSDSLATVLPPLATRHYLLRPSPAGYCHPPTGRVAGRYCYLPAPSELDVRVAPHPAQAFTNAPCGTRSLLSVFLARGSADDSWRVETPCYPPFQDRLGYAKSDDGSDSRPLLSAAVDHRPHIVPLVSSRD